MSESKANVWIATVKKLPVIREVKVMPDPDVELTYLERLRKFFNRDRL